MTKTRTKELWPEENEIPVRSVQTFMRLWVQGELISIEEHQLLQYPVTNGLVFVLTF